MRLKIILLISLLISIFILALIGFGIKEKAVQGMIKDISEYNCGPNNLCTSCIINGNTCSCGQNTCSCGNDIVDKAECELYS